MLGKFMIKNRLLFLPLALFLLAGCSKRSKDPNDMSFDELKTQALSAVDRKKNDIAIGYLEQLVAQFPENQDIFEYKFMLADFYMKTGRLEEAYKMYKHYTKFYPSEDRAEDAHYKSILAKFYQTMKVSRSCDDTDAQQTMKRCKDYMANATYSKYRNDIKDIQYTCEARLIDKEVYVFNTYLRRGKVQSAKNRVDYLRTVFLPSNPSLEAQILYLESKLAQKQENKDGLKEKVETLFSKHPDSQYTKMAQGLLKPKKGFIF
ncbi:outer membrane protein assembly factor BamD [Candidatus Babeliales bacterium]|nr:outer membrane protein assembly factor BamD [Candidatus Babeliales bacterium]